MAPKKTEMKKGSKRYPRRQRTASTKGDYARVTETHEFDALAMGTAYRDYQASLARCERASAVAKGFQEYRISKVEYHFLPQTDTYLPAQYPVPQLYTRVDKSGALGDIISVAQMVQTGVKPRRFDDKNIVIKYKPAVLNFARDASNGTNIWAQPKVSPWLSTNKTNTTSTNWAPSSIDHLGIVWVVDCTPPSGQPALNYSCRMVIHYEFRKPNALAFSSEETVGAKQVVDINGPEAPAV